MPERINIVSTPRQRRLALMAMAVAVGTWGLSNVAIKAVTTTGLVASFYRLWFVIPLMWSAVILVPAVRRRLTRAWLTASLGGGALFGVHQILFFNSLKLTSVVNVTVIGSLQPILVLALAGPLFGERITARAAVWSAVALCGTVVVVAGSAGTPAWSAFGDAVAVANLFAFTAYFLASKRFRRQVGAIEYVIGMTTVAGFVVAAAVLVSGQDASLPSTRDILILLGVAIIPGTCGHLLTNWAHGHAPAFVMSIMLLAVPVIASVGAAIFLGDALSLAQVAGGTLVLVAIATIVRSVRSDAATQELAATAAATDAP